MPDKPYINSNHRIEAETDKDLSNPTEAAIHYTKPSGAIGAWAATVEGGYVVVYETEESDINERGLWSFYPDVTAGGRRYIGNPFTRFFYNPGE